VKIGTPVNCATCLREQASGPQATGYTACEALVRGVRLKASLKVQSSILLPSQSAPPMKHLVVVVADTLRRLDQLPYSFSEHPAPFLDSLRRGSMEYSHFLASSPLTGPSHRSLLLGHAPWGVRTPPEEKSQPGRSIAEAWKACGGASAAFVANPWLVEDPEMLREFDEVHSWRQSNLAAPLTWGCNFQSLLLGSVARKRWGMSRRSKQPTVARAKASPLESVLMALTGPAATKSLRSITSGRRVLSDLKSYLAARDRTRHQLLFLNFMEAHEPYSGTPEPGSVVASTRSVPAMNLGLLSAEIQGEWFRSRDFWAAYLGAIRELDSVLSTCFDILSKEGILSESLVVVLSDHGQSLGEHGFFGHGRFVYPELVEVPALMWAPKSLPGHDRGRVPEWTDHRHVHEGLNQLIDSGGDMAALSQHMSAARERVGPAISCFNGRPLQGFNPGHRSSRYVDLALRQGDSSCNLCVGLEYGKRETHSGPLGDHLLKIGQSAVSESLGQGQPRSLDSSQHHLVSERLVSWGY